MLSCSECIFWKSRNETHGECHRRAPRPNSIGDQIWPRTSFEDGCGEGILELSPTEQSQEIDNG